MCLEAFSVLTCLGNFLTSEKKRKGRQLHRTQERMDERWSSGESGHYPTVWPG